MSDGIKTALIAGVVSLVVGLITAVVNYYSIKKAHKDKEKDIELAQHEAKRVGITQQRMVWIMEIRRIFAEIISFDLMDTVREKDGYNNFNKTTQLLKLYLNFGGSIDKKILDSLDEMHGAFREYTSYRPQTTDYKDLKGTFDAGKEDLQKYAHIYLKSEWNRVKFESDPNNIGENYNEDIEIEKLENDYIESSIFIKSRPERQAEAVRALLQEQGV